MYSPTSDTLDPIRHYSYHTPDNPVIKGRGFTITYEMLDHRIQKAMAGLSEYGNHIGIAIVDPIDFISALWAGIRMGKALYLLPTKLSSDYHNLIKKTYHLDVCLTECPYADTPLPNAKPFLLTEPSLRFFTSGTTDHPKCVVHHLQAFIHAALSVNSILSVKESSHWLLNLPLYHVSGFSCVTRIICAGGTLVLDPVSHQHELTHLSFVERQCLSFMHDYTAESFPHLKAVVCGGGPIKKTTLEQGLSLNLPLYTSYGATETAAMVSLGPVHPHHLFSSGTCLPHVKLTVVNHLLYIQSLSCCLGYLTPEGDINPLRPTKNGITLNDRAQISSDGQITILGRLDNGFMCAGETLHPEPIESVLKAHPEVEEAIVVPIPDVSYGHVPVAFIKTNANLDSLKAILTHDIQTSFSTLYVPKQWHGMPNIKGLKLSRHYLKKLAKKNA